MQKEGIWFFLVCSNVLDIKLSNVFSPTNTSCQTKSCVFSDKYLMLDKIEFMHANTEL